MGSGGAKKTNQLLQNQTNTVNTLEREIGNRSQQAYSQQGDLRNELLNNYRGLYSSVGSDSGGGGGGGGGGYTPVEWSSSSMPFYTEAMNTGLYDDTRRGLAESYATGPITGMYDSLMRTIAQQRAGQGLTSYGGGTERLARDRGYAMTNAALGAKLGINKEIDENRFRGAGGVTGLESEKRAFESSERSRAASAAASAASRAASSASADRAYQMAILGRMEGLMPEDLPYIDRQLAANQLATGTITSRVNETPLWQRTLASVVPAAAGSVVGAFTGGGSIPKKRPVNYGDYRSDYGDY